jgi:hypothetical protein
VLDEMSESDHTNRIIRQGRAFVKAIEGLSEVDPTGLVERLMIRMLLDSYKQRLDALVTALPAWAVEEILSAGERVGDDGAVLWMDNN